MTGKSSEEKYYQGKTQRDLLIEVHTTVQGMKEGFSETVRELKDEDDKLHGRISKANDKMDKKVKEVHDRVDRIRWWSIGSGGIGGFIGALFRHLTGAGGGE